MPVIGKQQHHQQDERAQCRGEQVDSGCGKNRCISIRYSQDFLYLWLIVTVDIVNGDYVQCWLSCIYSKQGTLHV